MFVCLLFIYLFEQVDVLAAIQLMWTCYTHTPIYSEDSHNTGNLIPYSSRIVCGFFNVPQDTYEHQRYRAYDL